MSGVAQVVDMRTGQEVVDSTKVVLTAPVRRVCEPVPRRMVALGPPPPPHVQRGRFTVLTYNILADLYTTTQQFPTTEMFALQWQYRRQVILKELALYDADIVCLQARRRPPALSLCPQRAGSGVAGVSYIALLAVSAVGAAQPQQTCSRERAGSAEHVIP
jgi:hypothetical protein